MSYTDAQLKDATQVAYANLQEAFEDLKAEGKTPPFAIEELKRETKAKQIDLSSLNSDHITTDISNWSIVDYCDNKETGFYGCVIDTGDGNAIVAFRGSESMTDMNNLEHDWIEADLGLLNHKLTNQQADVTEFMKNISQSEYIKDYKSISITGHSLGGNLAEHACIISTVDKSINLDSKIDRCVSFDGPGFSTEYFEDKEGIAEAAKKITHYQWSLVGDLLNQVPGSEYHTLGIKSAKERQITKKIDKILYYVAGRHDTRSIIFDESGKAVYGEKDVFSLTMGYFSRGIERMPQTVCDIIYSSIGGFLICLMTLKDKMYDPDRKELTALGWAIVSVLVGIVIKIGVVDVVFVLGKIVLCIAVAVIVIAAGEFIIEKLEIFVDQVAIFLLNIYDWSKEKISEFKKYVYEMINTFKQWWNKNLNTGYQYATSHVYIQVDTVRLRSYAERLQNVNRRIVRLDVRMDALYMKVGLTDLWTLLQADVLTGYSWRLNRCIAYLNDTASDFESVERTIASQY